MEANPAHLFAEAKDRSAFERKYRGKTVEFRGVVHLVQRDGATGKTYIVLGAQATGKPCEEYYCYGTVACATDRYGEAQLEKALSLGRQRQTVAARGIFEGMVNVWPAFGQCTIPALDE